MAHGPLPADGTSHRSFRRPGLLEGRTVARRREDGTRDPRDRPPFFSASLAGNAAADPGGRGDDRRGRGRDLPAAGRDPGPLRVLDGRTRRDLRIGVHLGGRVGAAPGRTGRSRSRTVAARGRTGGLGSRVVLVRPRNRALALRGRPLVRGAGGGRLLPRGAQVHGLGRPARGRAEPGPTHQCRGRRTAGRPGRRRGAEHVDRPRCAVRRHRDDGAGAGGGDGRRSAAGGRGHAWTPVHAPRLPHVASPAGRRCRTALRVAVPPRRHLRLAVGSLPHRPGGAHVVHRARPDHVRRAGDPVGLARRSSGRSTRSGARHHPRSLLHHPAHGAVRAAAVAGGHRLRRLGGGRAPVGRHPRGAARHVAGLRVGRTGRRAGPGRRR